MKALWCAALLALLPTQEARAWGQEGHSIIGEIAQREMQQSTRDAIDKLLRHGSLGSVASWADDVKFTTHQDTKPWHFVDIPLNHDTYEGLDCKNHHDPSKPDECLVMALNKLKNDLSCATTDDAKRDALRFIVHLVGDSTQPLHTVDDLGGGNGLIVKLDFCGLKDTACQHPDSVKFHGLWDSTLITETFYDWGGYVDRLYQPNIGWLNSAAARGPDPAGDDIIAWVNDTHKAAKQVWTAMLPANHTIDQNYYDTALPILDRQLGIGGLRLARFLDQAFAPGACRGP